MYTYTGSGSAFWFAPCLPPGSLDHARPTSICECATHTCPHAWTIPTDCGTMMPYQGLVHCIAFCVFGVRFVLAACLALASPDTFSFVLEVEVHAYTHSLYLYIYMYIYIYIYRLLDCLEVCQDWKALLWGCWIGRYWELQL
jgi:hypothetical protein